MFITTTAPFIARARRGAHLCALLLGLQAASGDVLVDDPFTDGSRTNTGGGDPLGLVYYRNTTTYNAK